jgi:hypothetical protein
MRLDESSIPDITEGVTVLATRLALLLTSLALAAGGLAGAAAAASPDAKRPKKCHPSYTGACLDPNASDYDCIGGSGNGPKYTGKVRVVGPDVFRLDTDHDGWGCE